MEEAGYLAMKIGVLTVAFDDWPRLNRLRAYVNSIPDLRGNHIWLSASKSWNGGFQDLKGQGEWPNEAAQRNECLALASQHGLEWTIVLDTDEYITREGLSLLVAFLGQTKASVVLAGKMVTLFKTLDWSISPPETHKPVIAIRIGHKFKDNRCVDDPSSMETLDASPLYHASYVRNDVEIIRKLASFGHSHQVRPGWYDQVWRPWTPEMRNLHPIHGPDYAGVAPSNLPEEVRSYFSG